MTDHTPGPWHFCKPDRVWLVYPECAVDDGVDYFIARAINVDGREAEAKANARLIAAAPDLLEALKTCICPAGGWTGKPDNVDPTVENCMRFAGCGCDCGAAIRKATGG